jgi:hypothetical protein
VSQRIAEHDEQVDEAYSQAVHEAPLTDQDSPTRKRPK